MGENVKNNNQLSDKEILRQQQVEQEKQHRAKKKEKREKAELKKSMKKTYTNPLQRTWGKILLIVLMLAMVLGTILTLVFLMIDNFTTV